jgi:hypothetical protein
METVGKGSGHRGGRYEGGSEQRVAAGQEGDREGTQGGEGGGRGGEGAKSPLLKAPSFLSDLF